jgi:hypothetical protein
VVGDSQALDLMRQIVSATDAAAELARRQLAQEILTVAIRRLQQAFYAQAVAGCVAGGNAAFIRPRELNRLMGLWGGQTRWSVPARLPRVPASLPSFRRNRKSGYIATSRSCGGKERGRKHRSGLDPYATIPLLDALALESRTSASPAPAISLDRTVQLGLPILQHPGASESRTNGGGVPPQPRTRPAALAVANPLRRRVEAASERSEWHAAGCAALHPGPATAYSRTILSETLKSYNGMLTGRFYELLC